MRRACSSGVRRSGLLVERRRQCSAGPRYSPRRAISAATAGGTSPSSDSPRRDASAHVARRDRRRLDLEEARRGPARRAGENVVERSRGSRAASRRRGARARAPRRAPSRSGSRELVGADEEDRVVARRLGAEPCRSCTRCGSELDARRRGNAARASSRARPDVDRASTSLCAGIAGDEDDAAGRGRSCLERAPRERDVAVVRRVERAAEEPDHCELERLVADLDLGARARARRLSAALELLVAPAACRRRGSRGRCAGCGYGARGRLGR